MSPDDFFGEGEDRPARVGGRYRLPHPETGVEQSWTAATTHAELPEDSYALTKWLLRQLLVGLRRRPDLLRLVESWADEPGSAQLDEVIAAAHEVAGNDAKANLGTAVHGVLQRVDRAWNERRFGEEQDAWFAAAGVPEWALPHARGYVAELDRHGLTPIPTMTERRVINLALGCAGTLDNLYSESDGAVVLGDKKTGRLDYPERKYAIQQAVYRDADYMLDPAGGPPVDLRSLGLRYDYAVLVHVDPESGACSVYRVDLRRGRLGANLAVDTREWRGQRHLLLPYVAPTAVREWQAAESPTARPSDALPAFATELQRRQFDEMAQQRHLRVVPDKPPTQQPSTDPNAPFSESGLPQHDPGTHAVSGGLVDDRAEQAFDAAARNGVWTADDLMKLSKAELQAALRRLDPGASVAHQRKILADKILKLQNGGQVATTTPSDQTTFSTGRIVRDPAELPAGPLAPGDEDPTDPRSPAFHRARLAEIAAAPSVAELGRIHQGVVRRGGDQAWTDAMTEAARARTAELDATMKPPYEPGIEWNGKLVSVRQAIAEAGSSQEMAEVWRLTTVGGSDESRWTPELNELAHARLAALDAARPAPPSNPFGNQQ